MSAPEDPRGPNIRSFPKAALERAKTTILTRELRAFVTEGFERLNIPLEYTPRAALLALKLSKFETAQGFMNEAEDTIEEIRDGSISLRLDRGHFARNCNPLIDELIRADETKPYVQEMRNSLERILELMRTLPPEMRSESMSIGEKNPKIVAMREQVNVLRDHMEGPHFNPSELETAFRKSFFGTPKEDTKIRIAALTEFLPLMLKNPAYMNEWYGNTAAELLERAGHPFEVFEPLYSLFIDSLSDRSVPEKTRVAALAMIQRALHDHVERLIPGETLMQKVARRDNLKYFWNELCGGLDLNSAGGLVTKTPAEFDITGPKMRISTTLRYLYPGEDARPPEDPKLVDALISWYRVEVSQAQVDYQRIGGIGAHLYRSAQAGSFSARKTYEEIERTLRYRMHNNIDIRDAYLILLASTHQSLEHVAAPTDWPLLSNHAAYFHDAEEMKFAHTLFEESEAGKATTTTFDWADILKHYENLASFA